MELKDIKELIALMKKNDLSVFKMENEGFKITLKKGTDFQPVITAAPAPVAVHAPVPAPAAAAATSAPDPVVAGGKEITSPMVGTFYRASSPESANLVEIGSVVTPDTVICIIEAMKVMNEVKAEVSGTITEVCAENGKPVQFGQALFKVK